MFPSFSLRRLLTRTSIAATSADAERGFSRGRLTVSRLRHSLNDDSIRATTLVGSWARIDGLIPEKLIIRTLDPNSDPSTHEKPALSSAKATKPPKLTKKASTQDPKGKGKASESQASTSSGRVIEIE